MKKILVLFLIFLLIAPLARAAELPLVVDEAGLLTAGERTDIQGAVERISAVHQFDVVIATVPEMGGKAARDYAADYYDGNGYGQGDGFSGILLLLAMEEREWYILTTGAGIDLFSDDRLDEIAADVVPLLSEGAYAAGLIQFAWCVEAVLDEGGDLR